MSIKVEVVAVVAFSVALLMCTAVYSWDGVKRVSVEQTVQGNIPPSQLKNNRTKVYDENINGNAVESPYTRAIEKAKEVTFSTTAKDETTRNSKQPKRVQIRKPPFGNDVTNSIRRRKRRNNVSPSVEDPLEVLRCGESCSCYQVNTTIYDEEYRVICNNTKGQAVSLTSAVFVDQAPPTYNLLVYVRVNDVSALIVTPEFVSRWTAYTSCALDVWKAGDVVLPTRQVPRAPTGAYSHVFAGLGVVDSRLSHIPRGVFADIQAYGIELLNVTMPVLNLYNLVYPPSNKLRYLRMNGVILGALKGVETIDSSVKEFQEYDYNEDGNPESDCCHIDLQKGRAGQKKTAGVWVNNSQIGVVEANALSFKSDVGVVFSLVNTKIGMIKNNGVKLLKNVQPRMINATVTLEGQGSFFVDHEVQLVAKDNRIVLPAKVFNTLNCTRNDIQGNEFIIVKEPSEEIEKEFFSAQASRLKGHVRNNTSEKTPANQQGNVLSKPHEHSVNNSFPKSFLQDFIHPSCVNLNKILNIPMHTNNVEASDSPRDTTTSLPVVSSTQVNYTQEQPDSELLPQHNSSTTLQLQPIVFFPESSNSTAASHVNVHKGFAYLILVGLGVLLLVVLVLAALLVFRKKRRDEDEDRQQSTSRDRRPSLMYVPGSSVYGNDAWPGPSSDSRLL